MEYIFFPKLDNLSFTETFTWLVSQPKTILNLRLNLLRFEIEPELGKGVSSMSQVTRVSYLTGLKSDQIQVEAIVGQVNK